MVDPAMFRFDQRPFGPRAPGIQIGHFMKGVPLMLAVSESDSHNSSYNPSACIGGDQLDVPRILTPTHKPGQQRLPVALNEPRLFFFFPLADSHSRERWLPSDAKDLRDDLTDIFILPAVEHREQCVDLAQFPTSGQRQTLTRTEVAFELPHPRFISMVLVPRGPPVRQSPTAYP